METPEEDKLSTPSAPPPAPLKSSQARQVQHGIGRRLDFEELQDNAFTGSLNFPNSVTSSISPSYGDNTSILGNVSLDNMNQSTSSLFYSQQLNVTNRAMPAMPLTVAEHIPNSQHCFVSPTLDITNGVNSAANLPTEHSTGILKLARNESVGDLGKTTIEGSPAKKVKKSHHIEDITCHCKRSRCLQLYCDCFASQQFCITKCACQDCLNKTDYEDTVLEARETILLKSPNAFSPKIVTQPVEDEVEQETSGRKHRKGCNCKNSSCLKKYCECYKNSVGCSNECRCEGCKNSFGKREGVSESGEGGNHHPAELVNVKSDGSSEKNEARKRSLSLPDLHNPQNLGSNPHNNTPLTSSTQFPESLQVNSRTNVPLLGSGSSFLSSPTSFLVDSNRASFHQVAGVTDKPDLNGYLRNAHILGNSCQTSVSSRFGSVRSPSWPPSANSPANLSDSLIAHDISKLPNVLRRASTGSMSSQCQPGSTSTPVCSFESKGVNNIVGHGTPNILDGASGFANNVRLSLPLVPSPHEQQHQFGLPKRKGGSPTSTRMDTEESTSHDTKNS